MGYPGARRSGSGGAGRLQPPMPGSITSTGSSRVAKTRIGRAAHDMFGFDAFRSGQLHAMEALANRLDTLAVLPTGAGKSAIYQIAALMKDS